MISKDIESNDINHSVLPIIPLSPIVQSLLECSKALNIATEKLQQAKKANPPVQVSVLRNLIESSKVESQRLATISQKMQSVEAATALFWDPDTLARQIATIDSQLYNQVFLDKRVLSQLDKEQSKLCHLVDFSHYLCHSFAHQLIFWCEISSNSAIASEVVPPIGPKDNLVSHLVRVAYLLLHAYRDFSGCAALLKALTFPEVRRLDKKLWQQVNSRTKDMFRELVQIISPVKNYQAYHAMLRQKLEPTHHDNMLAVPWIQPHLYSIRSIVEAYTAGDNENQFYLGGDIVLSTPGANKLDLEIAILELCQQSQFTCDFSMDEVLSANGEYKINPKRASTKPAAIHIEGSRNSVMPVSNLKILMGNQLTFHWLVSRVYLRKDQLINESIEVEPLRSGETIACDSDELEETVLLARFNPTSTAASRRTSFTPASIEEEEILEQELVDMTKATIDIQVDDVHESDSDEDDNGGEPPVISEASVTKADVDEPMEQELVEIKYKSVELKELEEIKHRSVELKELEEIKPAKSTTAASLSVQSSSSTTSKQKSRLSPTAPEFIPGSSFSYQPRKPASMTTTEEKWSGYPANEDDTATESEKWEGYPGPTSHQEEEDDDDEVWRGYPARRVSSQSEISEEWKGYQATKMEATWQRESELKVQQHEWQGYTLETLDEDELDSSTMMNGEFEKSRKARRRGDY